jgi:hypothetical protein
MRAHVIALSALSALILTGIFGVATHAAVALNEGGTEVVAIDVFGLSGQSDELDELSAQKRRSH